MPLPPPPYTGGDLTASHLGDSQLERIQGPRLYTILLPICRSRLQRRPPIECHPWPRHYNPQVTGEPRVCHIPSVNEQYWPGPSGRQSAVSGSNCRVSHNVERQPTRRGGGISHQQRPSESQSVWIGCSAGLQSYAIRGVDITTRRSRENRACVTYRQSMSSIDPVRVSGRHSTG